jgi:hypothetical protein
MAVDVRRGSKKRIGRRPEEIDLLPAGKADCATLLKTVPLLAPRHNLSKERSLALASAFSRSMGPGSMRAISMSPFMVEKIERLALCPSFAVSDLHHTSRSNNSGIPFAPQLVSTFLRACFRWIQSSKALMSFRCSGAGVSPARSEVSNATATTGSQA